MKEFVTLVNDRDEVIGSKDRSLLTDDDRWRIVTIWLENTAGDILLAQRSHNKKNNPGKWGPAAAGTVEHGESYEETAIREVHEELGITVPLEKTGLIMHKSMIGHRADMGFRGITDTAIENFYIQADEVEQIKWVGKEALLTDIAQHPANYIQEMLEIVHMFMDNQYHG